MRLPAGRATAAGWAGLLIALTALTAILFLARAFADRFAIPDDARQFLAWTARLRDPAAMAGDPIADYWQSVSPPLFRAIYAVPASLGIAPLITAKLLVPLLLIITAIAAWRVARAVAPRPAVAFVAAACMMLVEVHDDSIFSATPRALFPPLFLLFLDGLLRERRGQAVVALGLVAAIYPTPAVTGLTMIGLSRIRWRPAPRPDLSRGSVLFVVAAIAAVALAVLPFRGEMHGWGPVVSFAEARAMPNFMSPEGRTNLVDRNGQIEWVCSDRMGFVPAVINCHGVTSEGGVLDLLLFILPLAVLTGRAVRRLRHGETVGTRELVYAQAFVASLLWWSIAAAVAFDIYLPSRYSQRVLALVGALALGKLIGEGLACRPILRAALTLGLIAGFLTPKMRLYRPRDETAVAQIAAMAPGTRIAGISAMLDFVPALTGRTVLAAAELAIPYQLGYFRPLQQRLADTARALAAPDRATFARFVERYRVNVILVDRALLAGAPMPERFATLAPNMVSPGPNSWVAAHAAACTLHRGRTVLLLDAKCLANGRVTLP